MPLIAMLKRYARRLYLMALFALLRALSPRCGAARGAYECYAVYVYACCASCLREIRAARAAILRERKVRYSPTHLLSFFRHALPIMSFMLCRGVMPRAFS